jgi:hypothetical protein
MLAWYYQFGIVVAVVDGKLAPVRREEGKGKMKIYKINQQHKTGDDYETMVIRNRETGEKIAEYRLTPGCERAEISAMRRTIDKHLSLPGNGLGNYQW